MSRIRTPKLSIRAFSASKDISSTVDHYMTAWMGDQYGRYPTYQHTKCCHRDMTWRRCFVPIIVGFATEFLEPYIGLAFGIGRVANAGTEIKRVASAERASKTEIVDMRHFSRASIERERHHTRFRFRIIACEDIFYKHQQK